MLGATITGESHTKHYISKIQREFYDKRDVLYLMKVSRTLRKQFSRLSALIIIIIGPTLLSETHKYNNIFEFPFKRLTSQLNLCMKCWARRADKLLCQMFHRSILLQKVGLFLIFVYGRGCWHSSPAFLLCT